MSEHNWVRKVEEFAAANEGRFESGTVHDIAIRHDPWCRLLKGGWCNCDPEVAFLDRTPSGARGPGRGVKP
jgi:hypothetical protein